MNNLWYPYSQMKLRDNKYKVLSAKGANIKVLNKENGEINELTDAISSWWCAVHGYNNDEINNAIKDQMELFSHVMLGGLTHDPAEKLSEKLVELLPDGLNHVFFSDSGSVGVEVALKMAIQYYSNLGYKGKTKFIGLQNAYHGDTFKAMEVGDDPDFHGAFNPIFKDCYHVTAPESGYDLSIDKLKKSLSDLENILKENHDNIAAFIVEPLIQASGGFNFYSPLYLNKAKELCDKYDVLLIFDEVATGFGRTGKMFAVNHTNIVPDIIILGKALTGGYLGHAATITNDKVYNAFYGDSYEKAFMHGPTFMGNALACAASLKSIEIFKRDGYLDKIKNLNELLTEQLYGFKSDKIKDIRIFGVTAVIEMHDSKDLVGIQDYGFKKGVWIRPVGKYLYTMPSYTLTEEELKKITNVMKNYLNK